jgi:hypothetical protein
MGEESTFFCCRGNVDETEKQDIENKGMIRESVILQEFKVHAK